MLVMGGVNRGLGIVGSCLGYVWADFSKPSRVVAQLMLPLNVVNREVLGEARARTPDQLRRAHVYARIVARRRARMQLLMSCIRKASHSHSPL